MSDRYTDAKPVRPRFSWPLFLLLVLATGAIGVIDFYTGPTLNIEFFYFVPISLAAWILGRGGAWTLVAIDIIPTYLDHLGRVQSGEHSFPIAIANVVVRVLVYAFVAELVSRLVLVQRQLRQTGNELRQVYDSLQQDVAAASLLQGAVLEHPLPAVPRLDIAARMIYARALGGDFWEAVGLDDGLHFAVADVAGKGIPAALFTTLLKHLLEEARRISHDPGHVLHFVNSQLHRRLPESVFITMFYGYINSAADRLTYASAGHDPAILRRARNHELTELYPTAMVMGLQEYENVPESVCLDLSPCDAILVYTDGLTDARTSTGERLGEEFPFSTMLTAPRGSAQDILDYVLNKWEESTLRPRPDDVTLICVKTLA